MPALDHFRMLDLSRQLPGPFCSTLLADLGMDVIAVDAPGDVMGLGIPFMARNKRSVTINLKTPEGRAVFERLLGTADVLLEGFRPGVTARLGVDWETVRRDHPRLVYCSITGYGQDGPYRDRVGHDLNYLGYAGVLGFLGEAGRPPIVPGVQIADIGGGALMAAVGILTALIARERTGRGQQVDVAMCDGAAAWNVYHTLLWLMSGREPARGDAQMTGRHPCYAVYETRDGRYVTVGAYEAHFWATLCRHFGREDFIAEQWAEDPKRQEMFAFFRAAFREKTLAEWRAELGDAEICFGPVNSLAEAFADPQLRHRGIVQGDGSPERPFAIGTPVRLSDTPPRPPSAPTRLGEHTDEVLLALGVGPEELVELHRRGVV